MKETLNLVSNINLPLLRCNSLDISAPLSRRKKASNAFAFTVLTLFGIVTLFSVGVVLLMASDRLANPSSYSTNSRTPTTSSLRSISHPPPVLVLQTKHGAIRIRLRPDLSPESVQHIQTLTTTKSCDACRFYRSEKDLLLQGIMRSKDLLERPAKGPCPPAMAGAKQNCPPHDPNCACHGPTMTKGMVGWAGGGNGPDFFINVFDKPADWWGQQHTVWGVVEDPESLDRIRNQLLAMPVQIKGGMHMLEEPFDFQMSME